MSIDETKLNEFLGKAVGDLGAAMSATLMLVGDRLGLYKELARGPVTSTELARRTGTSERYIREWLGNQGAGGYVQYDSARGQWSLSAEQALCLADPNGPVDMPGAYNIVEATFHALGRTLDGVVSKTQGRRKSSRRWLRSWGKRDPHGNDVSKIALYRLRLPCRFHSDGS